ncbi:glycosyltransferase [Dactylosporangium darangshiense]|uniref:Glycosyltransferase n=1 Tax=Dactylosporangium darangshiense TaxID=579108 RepID=A0ABP8DNQ2_9ACTN
MTTAILLTHGTGGDVNPFVAIGRELRRQGHDVVLLTHAPYAAAARDAGLRFEPIDTGESHERHELRTPQLLQARGPAALGDFYRQGGLIDQIRREVDLLRKFHRPGETVLVGRHTSALSTLIAAESTGAPCAWVALSPTQIRTTKAALVNVRNGLGGELDGIRAAAGLAPMAHWAGWFELPDLIVGAWPRWFDEAGERSPARVRLTGFIRSDADVPDVADLPAFAPGAPRPILVTGGTGRMHDRFYALAVEAAARLDRPTLVVAPDRAMLPGPLPPGAHWVPRLPFPAAFPRAGVVLHHGGIGTAATALAAGAPQVVLADGSDRPDNAARLAAHGLARWADAADCTPERLAALLEAALADTGHATRYAEVRDPSAEPAERVAAALVAGLAGTVVTGTRAARMRLAALTPAQRAQLLARRANGAA